MTAPRLAVGLRAATEADHEAIATLYRRAAATPSSGLAHAAEEVTADYVTGFVRRALDAGIALVAVEAGGPAGDGGRIVGEIHAWRSPLAVFAHVLGDLTIAVDPECQGRGVGRALFTEFVRLVRDEWPAIERVELVTRESNTRAIAFYESLGFRREGRLERRIRRRDGGLEADVPMGWLRNR